MPVEFPVSELLQGIEKKRLHVVWNARARHLVDDFGVLERFRVDGYIAMVVQALAFGRSDFRPGMLLNIRSVCYILQRLARTRKNPMTSFCADSATSLAENFSSPLATRCADTPAVYLAKVSV